MSPTEDELLRLINSAYLFIFVCELALVLVILTSRMAQYRRAGWSQPRLLRRDILLFGGLLIPFAFIFVRRFLELDITNDLLWVVITGTPPLIAVGYWIYVELFEIGRPKVG